MNRGDALQIYLFNLLKPWREEISMVLAFGGFREGVAGTSVSLKTPHVYLCGGSLFRSLDVSFPIALLTV